MSSFLNFPPLAFQASNPCDPCPETLSYYLAIGEAPPAWLRERLINCGAIPVHADTFNDVVYHLIEGWGFGEIRETLKGISPDTWEARIADLREVLNFYIVTGDLF